jgi:Domain of unknown function (DUF4328)
MSTGSPYAAAPPPPLNYPPPVAYAPLGGRLTAVKAVFWGIVAVSALAAVSELLEILLINREIDGEEVSASQYESNDLRQSLVGMLQFALYLAGIVVFIMWMFRAYRNVDAVAPRERRYGRGWAIGGWFVPFLNLWRPKQVINDIWRAGGAPPEPSGLLFAWWTLWIITNWVSNLALRSAFDSETAEDYRSRAIAYLASDLMDIPTAILAILVAIALTRRLDAKAAEGPPPPPPPEPEEPEGSFEIPWRPPPPPLNG